DALALSPDGSWLAAADENLVVILDARTGQPAASLRGHDQRVVRVAFSPDARRLASTSDDGTALVWDVEAATGRRAVGLHDAARQAQLWDELAGPDGLAAHGIDRL